MQQARGGADYHSQEALATAAGNSAAALGGVVLPAVTAGSRSAWLAGDRLVLAALFVFALGIRCWNLGQRSFWLDELTFVSVAALDLADFLRALTLEANGSLYLWALFGWLRAVGFSADEALIRLLSALLGAAAVPLTYLVGRRLHSPRAGLAAALLLATHSFQIALAQEVRSYPLYSTLVVLSYLTLYRALERDRHRDWALHGLIAALAIYSHFYTALILIGQGLSVLAPRQRGLQWRPLRSPRRLAGPLLSGLVLAVLLLPLIPHFMQQSHGTKLAHLPPLTVEAVKGLALQLGGGSRATLLVYAGLVAVGLLLATRGARARERTWLLLPWLLVPVGLALGISLARPILAERYLLGALPPICLLAGIGLSRLPGRAYGLACLAVAALSLGSYWRGYDQLHTEAWRQVVAEVTLDAQQDDGYIFLSKWGQNGFEYYAGWQWGRNPSGPYLQGHVFEPFDWDQALAVPKYRGVSSLDGLPDFAARHRRIWLVQSHERDPVSRADVAAPVREWLTTNGYQLAQRDYQGVRVLRYER